MKTAGFTKLFGGPGPLPLDGGLARETELDGADLRGELWTARLLADDPRALERAHAAFTAAGARILISASYQASPAGFARHGLDTGTAAALPARSVRLARAAATRASDSQPVWVAGSVGPLGAVLGGGAEYRGRYGWSQAELTAFHQPRVESVLAGKPDVLALETIPDLREARALLRAVDNVGGDVPVWLSYTVAGSRTRAGQPLDEAFAVAAGHPRVIAAGVNCCDPAEVTAAVTQAVAATGLPAVAYPNSGERWDSDRHRWCGGATFDASAAGAWFAAGARLIGGCCQVPPAAIARLAGVLDGLRRTPGRR